MKIELTMRVCPVCQFLWKSEEAPVVSVRGGAERSMTARHDVTLR